MRAQAWVSAWLMALALASSGGCAHAPSGSAAELWVPAGALAERFTIDPRQLWVPVGSAVPTEVEGRELWLPIADAPRPGERASIEVDHWPAAAR